MGIEERATTAGGKQSSFHSTDMARVAAAAVLLALALLAGPAAGQATSTRNIQISGMKLTTTAFYETKKVHPLDDIGARGVSAVLSETAFRRMPVRTGPCATRTPLLLVPQLSASPPAPSLPCSATRHGTSARSGTFSHISHPSTCRISGACCSGRQRAAVWSGFGGAAMHFGSWGIWAQAWSPRIRTEYIHIYIILQIIPHSPVHLPKHRYYPLTTDMGTWPLQAGDELICELWECDGAETGCDPSRPTAVPDANAGDDYLGLLRLPMSAYKSDMSITTTFNDTKNAAVATVMLECDGCWATLRNNATWVNPYTPGEMPDYMMVNAPAASPPPPPSPVPSPPPTASPPTPTGSLTPPAATPSLVWATPPSVAADAPAPSVASPSVSPSATPPAAASSPPPPVPSPTRVPVVMPVSSPPSVSAYDGPPSSPPSSPSSDSDLSSGGGGGLSTGAIAGIAAVVVILALISLTWTICCFRKRTCCFAGRGASSSR